MWWTCPSTTKQHGSINPYPRWVNKKCGHGSVESLNKRIICFNGRGSKFHPPYKQHKRVLTNPQITTFEPFDKFHSPWD
jgi:hypothetical protein